MTRNQISAKVRDNLNDAGITYYSEADINDSIQDGYDEVVVYCECIDKTHTLNFLANTTYYKFSDLIPDYYRPVHLRHSTLNFFLDPIPERDLFNGQDNWEIASRQERDFHILGPEYIGISGRTANPVGGITIFYKAQAPVLEGNSVPQILESFQILLEHYATADLLEQNQEYAKAQKYWKYYDIGIEKYRSKIQLLSKSDRVFVR